MAQSLITCPVCSASALKANGEINRARKAGLAIYCGRECAGVARRKGLSKAEKLEAKRLYDIAYRERNRESRKAQKAEYHKRTYDPVKAAEERRLKMPRHVEYCRRPEYRDYKREYDRQYRAKQEFGEFWEASLLLLDLNAEIGSRISRTEIYAQNGTLNKKLNRRRSYDALVRG